MVFDRNEKKQVVALLGAGSMGTAIVRRIAAGKKILLGDISAQALERVSDDFRRSGYDVETCVVNALEKDSIEAFAKKAAELGPVMYFIDTAGASPNQASPEHIVAPLAYDEFNANGDGYQAMIDASAARRVATSDEIADAASFLLGEHAQFINGTDLLIDGGVIASIRTGQFQLQG